MNHKIGKRTLPDAPLSGNESDGESLLMNACFHHAMQAFDFFDTPDKELKRNGLPRSEWVRFTIHDVLSPMNVLVCRFSDFVLSVMTTFSISSATYRRFRRPPVISLSMPFSTR